MSSNAEGLSVIVVGGGIAGLAAARGLREQHRVTVIESSKFKNEIGAAVHLAPNITPILLGWGIDLELLKPVPAKRILLERDHQNNTLADVVLDSVKLYGSPWWWVHRGDLHAALRKLATDPNGPGKPAEILLGKTVTACDPSTGTVTLSDGTTMTADVIVGADGIKSTMRTVVLGYDYPCVPSGFSCYRCLFPGERVKGTALEFMIDKSLPTCALFIGPDRRIVIYPCRDQKLLNIVATLPDDLLREEVHDSYTGPGTLEHMRKTYESFHPDIKLIMDYPDECSLWQLRDHDIPLERWAKGRLIVVGDAAHSMLPQLGQGAAQALEDVDALVHVLKSASPGDVPSCLLDVEAVRYERAHFIQQASRFLALTPHDSSGKQKATLTYQCSIFVNSYPGTKEVFRRYQAGEALDKFPEIEGLGDNWRRKKLN